MREIQLSKGLTAFVDEEDYPIVSCYKWYAKRMGAGKLYAVRKTSRLLDPYHRQFLIQMHRDLMGCTTGDNKIVDHKNGDSLDNRRSCNLRIVTQQQNNQNRGLNKNQSSGYKGVRLRIKGNSKRWVAQIMCDKKSKHLGYFDTAEEAKDAYNKAAKELFGAYARLN